MKSSNYRKGAALNRFSTRLGKKKVSLEMPGLLFDVVREICFLERLKLTEFCSIALGRMSVMLPDYSSAESEKWNERLKCTSFFLAEDLWEKLRSFSHYKSIPMRRIIITCLLEEVKGYTDKHPNVVNMLYKERDQTT